MTPKEKPFIQRNKHIYLKLLAIEKMLDKFFNHISYPSYKRTISLLVLFLITLSIPVTLTLIQKRIETTQWAQEGTSACEIEPYNCTYKTTYPQPGGEIHENCDNISEGTYDPTHNIEVNVYSCPDGNTRYLTRDVDALTTPPPSGQDVINIMQVCNPLSLSPTWNVSSTTGCNVYITAGSCDHTISSSCNSTGTPNITSLGSCGNIVNGGIYQLFVGGSNGTLSSSPLTIACTTPPPSGNLDIGVNLRGGVFYGDRTILPMATGAHVDANLAELSSIGGSIVRVFAANKNVSDSEAASRLSSFLDKAASYNIGVIISLIDFYDSQYSPQGVSYTRCDFTPCLLGGDFFEGGYTGRYFEFVRNVVQANSHHTNIYAWEPGNELKYENNNTAFINFMNATASEIKRNDPDAKVATGMIASQHTALSPEALYPNLNNFDIITVHDYNSEHRGAPDAVWAAANNKPLIVEEGIWGGTHDRTAQYQQELDFWISQGADAFLQWGFMAASVGGDNGDGDGDVGMDNIWHSADYDSLLNLLSQYATGRPPVPRPTTPPGSDCYYDQDCTTPGTTCKNGYCAGGGGEGGGEGPGLSTCTNSLGETRPDGTSYTTPVLSSYCSSCIIGFANTLYDSYDAQSPGATQNCTQEQLVSYWCHGGWCPDDNLENCVSVDQCKGIIMDYCKEPCFNPQGVPPPLIPAPTYTQRPTTGFWGFFFSDISPTNIPSGPDALSNVSNTFVSLLVALGVIFSVALIIYSGIKFITAGGDKEKIESAKKALTYAIVGLLIIVLSFAIIRLLGNIIGARFNI